MKIRSIINVFAMAAAFSFASAEEAATSISSRSKALLFNFSGLNILGANAYNGGIGGKYFLSDAMALRGGLQFGLNNTSIPANPAAGQTGTDGSNSSLTYGANAGVELHLTSSRVSPYVGGALNLSSTSTETKNAVSFAGGVQTTTKNGGGAGFRVGVGGIAGVEFFLTKEISLGAEYMLGYAMTSLYDTESKAGTTTVTIKNGSTNNVSISNTGGLTLAVYF